MHQSDLHLPIPAGLSLPEDIMLGIRPEDVIPDPEGSYEGSIILKEPLEVETIVHLQTSGVTVVSLQPVMSRLNIGDSIRFRILPDRLHAFTTDGLRVQA